MSALISQMRAAATVDGCCRMMFVWKMWFFCLCFCDGEWMNVWNDDTVIMKFVLKCLLQYKELLSALLCLFDLSHFKRNWTLYLTVRIVYSHILFYQVSPSCCFDIKWTRHVQSGFPLQSQNLKPWWQHSLFIIDDLFLLMQ